jgi:hypothetical protein
MAAKTDQNKAAGRSGAHTLPAAIQTFHRRWL